MRGGEEIKAVERSRGFNASSTSLDLAASKRQQSSISQDGNAEEICFNSGSKFFLNANHIYIFLITGIKCFFQVILFSFIFLNKDTVHMAPVRDPGSFTRCTCDTEQSELGNVPGFIKAFDKTASSQLLMVIKAHENINECANGGF